MLSNGVTGWTSTSQQPTGCKQVLKVIGLWLAEVNYKSFGDILQATRDENHQNYLMSFDLAKEFCTYISGSKDVGYQTGL